MNADAKCATCPPAVVEFPRTPAQRLAALFAGNERAHGTHGAPDREGPKWTIQRTARTWSGPATSELWGEHLAGERPLGVVPIRDDGTCLWGSIDVDQYDADVLPLVEKIEAARLPLVPVRSKSGGLHLFLFLAEPAPAASVIAVLRSYAERLGVGGSEIFPKQTTFDAERGDKGNWIIVPHFGGTFGGRLAAQAGLKKTGAAMTVEEFCRIAEERRLPELPAIEPQQKRRARDPGSDMPPCLEVLEQSGVGEHEGRNNALFHFGVYAKLKHPDGWEPVVEEFNRNAMRPPLGSDEVQATIKSLRKKRYAYTCNSQPMAQHCDITNCRKRAFGVQAASRPRIDRMSIVASEPVKYVLEIDGGTMTVSARDLNYFKLFNEQAIMQLRRSFVPVVDADWSVIVNSALAAAKDVEPPPDIREGGKFHELLEEFLTSRSRGERREDLLLDRPWEDQDRGQHWFRLSGFEKFLERERVKMTRAELARHLRRLGGEGKLLKIKGKPVHCWCVPASVVTPTPELEPLPVPGVPI